MQLTSDRGDGNEGKLVEIGQAAFGADDPGDAIGVYRTGRIGDGRAGGAQELGDVAGRGELGIGGAGDVGDLEVADDVEVVRAIVGQQGLEDGGEEMGIGGIAEVGGELEQALDGGG